MQKLITTLISNCPEDTIQFAKDLSNTISYGSTIFMIGDLGSGKTTFTKGFAKGLGFCNEVQSPTYPILNEYSNSGNFIYHFDLYRLKNKKECLNIGLFEDDDVISIIEWPEKVHFKPKKRIEIYFKYFDNYNSRLLKIKFFGINEA